MPTERRIVLTGATGSGKTTLLSELAARGFTTQPELARPILERLKVEDNLSLSKGIEFQHLMWLGQLFLDQLTTSDELVIADRGLIDVLAHTQLARLNVPAFWQQVVIQQAYQGVKLAVLDPTTVPVSFTELQRAINPDLYYWLRFRRQYHQLLLELANLHGFEWVVLTGSVSQRLEQLLQLIDNGWA